MTDASAALDALGDPSRRRLLELLRPGERTVRELTDAVDVSQSAVSQHLRVLREAGLVSVRAEGTRRLYRVELDGLTAVRAYVDAFWDDVLAAFTAFADAAAEPPPPAPPPGRPAQPPARPAPEETHDAARPRAARRPRPPGPR